MVQYGQDLSKVQKKECEMLKKQQNVVRLGQIQLTQSPNKPKKCKVCKTKQNMVIYIRISQNTVGTVEYCQNCHVWNVTGKKWQQFIKNAIDLVDAARRLVE